MFRYRRPMSRKRVLTIFGAALLVVAAIAGVTTFAATQTSSATPAVTPAIRLPNGATIPPSLKPAFDAFETESARTVMLATQSPRARQFVEPPTYTPSPTRTPVAAPFVSLRIENSGYSPPFSKTIRATSRWEGYIYGAYTIVVAGKESDTAKEGFVGVAQTKYGGTREDTQYTTALTPTAHGSVKITAVDPFLLTLVAEAGTVFKFDLQTLTFK